ncbi:C-C motif chemokine 4-like [Protopterus annectens]|uniref:C-C motif chemokine 4-like n=1 Tax=Protopterus annectens TaxID=7888 RepID=UPI001CFA6896|nr:C-C motif chemokine 4-like [Protopterus annectens]
MMKMITLLVVALMIAIYCSETLAAPASLDSPTECCFMHTNKHLPRNLIADYKNTSRKCPLPAIILVTQKGNEVCADPEEKWVQTAMKALDEKKAVQKKRKTATT